MLFSCCHYLLSNQVRQRVGLVRNRFIFLTKISSIMNIFKLLCKGAFVFFLLLIFSFPSLAISFPEEKVEECIVGVKRSPILVGVPQDEIENWCNCTLGLIIDEGKEDKAAGGFCGHKYFR